MENKIPQFKKLNCITITTDASFNPHHNVGGYAFIISYDGNRIYKSGGFKKQPESAEEAEVMCIANALHTLTGVDVAMRMLIINTDCKFAVPKIESGDIGLSYPYLLANSLVKKVKHQFKCHVEFRHVKAHSGVQDKRSKANEWCDYNAKVAMREAVKMVKSNNESSKTAKVKVPIPKVKGKGGAKFDKNRRKFYGR